jgi:hypothetical protein
MLVETALMLEIQRTNPKVPEPQARKFASWVLEEADRNNLDPWLFHGIVYIESRWTPGVVRREEDGSCSIGLGQINVRRCEASKVQPLRDPRENLRRMGDFLSTIRDSCLKNCQGLKWLRFYNYNNKRYVTGLVGPVVDRCHAAYDEKDEQPSPEHVHSELHVSRVCREASL